MSKINRTPKGLQDIFGNTAAGVNPSNLLQDVRPSIDLLSLWLIEKTESVTLTASFGAVFQQQTIRVPQGELWIPLAMSADVTTTVIGESIVMVIGIANESNLIRVHNAESPYRVSTTALETYSANYTFTNIQPVTAGQYFYMQCHQFNAAGARTCQLKIRFVRVRV